jgi:hypothetical protein
MPARRRHGIASTDHASLTINAGRRRHRLAFPSFGDAIIIVMRKAGCHLVRPTVKPKPSRDVNLPSLGNQSAASSKGSHRYWAQIYAFDGVYQMGDVHARSWIVAGALLGIGKAFFIASSVLQRGVGISSVRAK